jgi:hypothetical protein
MTCLGGRTCRVVRLHSTSTKVEEWLHRLLLIFPQLDFMGWVLRGYRVQYGE